MNALVWLWLAERRGGVRRLLGSLRRPSRAIGLLFTAGLLAFFLWLRTVSAQGTPSSDAQGLGIFLSLIVLFGIIGGLSLGGILFAPSEIHFLIPGPFTDRALLLYRLARAWPGSALGGLFFSLFFVPGGRSLAASWLALTLLLITSHHLQTAVGSWAGRLGDTVHKRVSRVLRLFSLLLLAVLVLAVLHVLGKAGSWSRLLVQWSASAPGDALLFPGRVAAEAAFRGFTIEAVGAWIGLVGLLLLTGALALVAPLPDLTRSGVWSQRIGVALARRRRFGVVSTIPGEEVRPRGALPPARVFRGAGAIVWKNALALLRSPRPLVTGLLFAAFIFLPILYGAGGGRAGLMAGGVLLYLIPTMISGYLSFDFRRDLENLPLLRQLPVSAGWLVLAEVAVPVAAATLILWGVLLAAQLLGRLGPGQFVRSLAIAPIVSFLIVTIDNILVLWGPARSSDPQRQAAPAMAPFRLLGLMLSAAPAGAVLAAANQLRLHPLLTWGSVLTVLLCTATLFLAYLRRLYLRADPGRFE
jgi:hypothetical protein